MGLPTDSQIKLTEFVAPTVLTIPITEKIINDIRPFFPKGTRVIAGYLSEDQLYWKINYHWDVLREAIDHCLGLDLEPSFVKTLKSLKTDLDANTPDPSTGYRKSPKPGEPKDKSSHETILARHQTVSACKREFAKVVKDADVFKKTKRDPKALMLAYAPVASPNKGKHKTGYALDIAGNNEEIARITKSLGGYAFNEGSHVHCEWKNGVDTSGNAGADKKSSAAREIEIKVNQHLINQRHCFSQIA